MSKIKQFDSLGEASRALVAAYVPGSGLEIFPVYDNDAGVNDAPHHYEIANADEVYLRESGELQ